MVSVRFFTRISVAAAAAVIGTSAYAADLSLPQPPMPYQPAETGGWYLRGDVGVGMIGNTSLEYLPNPLNPPNDFAFRDASMGDTAFFGAGVGYEVNNWLRFDVTGEYRSKSDYDAFGIYTYGGGTFGDSYHGFLSSAVFLANAYVDLGTWWCLTPFVGVGVGGAYNMVSDFTDTGIGTSGSGVGPDVGRWNLAWAIHAGLAYNVTPTFKVELAYRYLNYGSVTDLINCAGGCNPDSYKFNHLSSQDFMLGVRWLLQPELPVAPPLMTRG